jgi:hypothetical protein
MISIFWPIGIWFAIACWLIMKFDKMIESKAEKNAMKFLEEEIKKKELEIAMRELDKELQNGNR